MKNVFKKILVAVIAAVIAVGALALSACTPEVEGSVNANGAKISSLEIENARTQFLVGDTFEYGEGFTIWAVYSDNSKTDVTTRASISKESSFDMSVAGDYQITVRYGGKIADYRIYVVAFSDILKKIEIDVSNVKTIYDLGEEISFDGIKLVCTYENAQNALIQKEITSVKDFDVEIKGPDGSVLTTMTLNALGKYTVTISSGDVKDSYGITVASVDISTVEGAIAAAYAFSGEVVSGTEVVNSSMYGTSNVYREFNFAYEFGDNYLNVKETQSEKEDLHLSIDADGALFCTRIVDGVQVPNNYSDADMMNGVPVYLWYQSYKAYGVEAAIANLYENGQTATNVDFTMSADADNREYSFSYSGLKFTFNMNARDYYETKVTFRLGERYNIEYARIQQGYWENNANFADDGSIAEENTTFRTDAETGITTPLKDVSKNINITVNQTTGQRVKTNPYSRDDFTVRSFDLKYDNKILEDGATITTQISAASRSLFIDIENILPASANFTNDALRFSLAGSHSGEVDSSTILLENGLQAYRRNNRIMISFDHGGDWTLIMRTTNIEKTVRLSVTGAAPEEMNTVVYNPLSKIFYKATDATTMAGGSLIFYGEVNEYADASQTAVVTSSNAGSANIEEVTVDGVSCFAFIATEAGEYAVKITSVADSSITCELLITVVAAPDMASLLSGKYTATDAGGAVFEVTFTPENTGGKICGSVKITKTPLGDDDNPDTENAKTQVLYYEVKDGTYEIQTEGVSGENLGVLLRLDTSTCDLVIEDQYGLCYKLVKAD